MNPNAFLERSQATTIAVKMHRFSCQMTLSLLAVLFTAGQAWSAPRALKPLFKGVELYSWHRQNLWFFSVLPGTNRNKTIAEITAPAGTIRGVAALNSKLARLAVGEQVIWQHPEAAPFALPPRATTDAIIQKAAAVGVTVIVNR